MVPGVATTTHSTASEARPFHARRRAADERDELAASYLCAHSITSSARASTVVGTSRPRALAVLKLMTSSYLVRLEVEAALHIVLDAIAVLTARWRLLTIERSGASSSHLLPSWPPSTAKFRLSALAQYLRCRRVGRHRLRRRQAVEQTRRAADHPR
jgi:hypothetical protein